jgi:integrase
MSIHRRNTKGGLVWRVQWRDEFGKQRSRTFSLKRDADAWDAKVRLAKRQGELAAMDAGRQTLADFFAEWWRLYAEPNLAPATLRSYARIRDRVLVPHLGKLQLRAITPERVQEFQVDLAAEGIGRESIRRALAVLQGMLERAVEWGRIPRNPVRSVRKPPQGRQRTIDAPSPTDVERIRTTMLAKGWARDAALVSVLAYAGLRPGEALALRWSDVKERTIVVDKALSFGVERTTKTGKHRSVRLLAPLSQDLREWRLLAGRPDDDALIFPRPDGEAWNEMDFRNWRRRRFKTAASACESRVTRPYDLRHGFASLLFAERQNPAEIASQMGHSLQMLLSTYTHVLEELREVDGLDAEEAILAARKAVAKADVAPKLPRTSNKRRHLHLVGSERASDQALSTKPTGRLELPTPSLRVKCSTS